MTKASGDRKKLRKNSGGSKRRRMKHDFAFCLGLQRVKIPLLQRNPAVKELLGQNQGATNVEIDKSGIKDFERLAKKYGVDFAVRKDKSVDPPRYLVFVRAKDADVLDAICKEYQAKAMTKDKRPSVLKQLNKLKALVASIPKKVREKKQERDL